LRNIRVLFYVLMVMTITLVFSSGKLAHADSSGCYAHRPNYIEGVFEVVYDSGCSGHDEPELDPVSSLAGSARELTWTVILRSDGNTSLVSATGPTFWFGGTVAYPKSFLGQAFVELQFYPDAIVTSCAQNGGFEVKYAHNMRCAHRSGD